LEQWQKPVIIVSLASFLYALVSIHGNQQPQILALLSPSLMVMMLLLLFNGCRLQVTHCYVGVIADFIMNPADVVKHHCVRWMITLGFIMQICFSHLIFPVSDNTRIGCCITVHLGNCLCVEVHLYNQEFNHCQFLGMFAKL
jgi:hypothetical protein